MDFSFGDLGRSFSLTEALVLESEFLLFFGELEAELEVFCEWMPIG